MSTQAAAQEPVTVYRRDYTEPSHWIDEVHLDFQLGAETTLVRSRMTLRQNPAKAGEALELMGEELELRWIKLDGRELEPGEYTLEEELLRIPNLPDACTLETEVAIHPEANTALSGLYASSGNLCTQCEAEGFRRITWFLDRPDVMATYSVRLEADKESFPVLLSNGNRVGQGELENGRHWAAWEDPFKKPSYLFALVAGQLVCHRGEFVTRSGRTIPLEIWVEPANLHKCEHALVSLQKSMKWDEEVFGLEIDLDLYMIFVADDFNMGAMENKGLNVFNSKCVLASPETATDADYAMIEGVIAHEYFHNWTGNRVTCRDWFQLTLKEGLTVFRDQEFSSDMASRAVQRIEDVSALRSFQFAEDASPMSHPIRPESYIEMNNFYTATVYEKGAEVVRLYHTILGKEGFRKGMDLYFERHDGQAVTCDDFRAAMADANQVDLGQLEEWYSQAGTPTLKARGEYDAEKATYTLHFTQVPPAGAEQPKPLWIPMWMGLLGQAGRELPLRLASGSSEASAGPGESLLLHITKAQQSFCFTDIPEPPVPSLLRGFSAPVRLECERMDDELAFLMAHDSDAFNRWDAGQELGRRLMLELCETHQRGGELVMNPKLIEAFRAVLTDRNLDGSLKALALALPGEALLGQSMSVVDPEGLHAARSFVRRSIAEALKPELMACYEAQAASGPYSNDQAQVNRRRLRNRVLGYLTSLEQPEFTQLAYQAYREADNMTDSEAALACLLESDGEERRAALQDFYDRWKDEPLVLDKWFRLQAMSHNPGTLDAVLALAEHPDFSLRNPNRARSLLGAFAMGNQLFFHSADGRGYAFLADQAILLDDINPQAAARMVKPFTQWKRFDEERRALMRAQLERIAAKPKLSKDVGEIVGRSLAE